MSASVGAVPPAIPVGVGMCVFMCLAAGRKALDVELEERSKNGLWHLGVLGLTGLV